MGNLPFLSTHHSYSLQYFIFAQLVNKTIYHFWKKKKGRFIETGMSERWFIMPLVWVKLSKHASFPLYQHQCGTGCLQQSVEEMLSLFFPPSNILTQSPTSKGDNQSHTETCDSFERTATPVFFWYLEKKLMFLCNYVAITWRNMYNVCVKMTS